MPVACSKKGLRSSLKLPLRRSFAALYRAENLMVPIS